VIPKTKETLATLADLGVLAVKELVVGRRYPHVEIRHPHRGHLGIRADVVAPVLLYDKISRLNEMAVYVRKEGEKR
jgi:hypothetical protein